MKKNRIRVFHPKREEWLDVYYSDKIYNANHLAELAFFTAKDIASMAHNPDEGCVCTRVNSECVMVTNDAIYVAREYLDGVKIEIIKKFETRGTNV